MPNWTTTNQIPATDPPLSYFDDMADVAEARPQELEALAPLPIEEIRTLTASRSDVGAAMIAEYRAKNKPVDLNAIRTELTGEVPEVAETDLIRRTNVLMHKSNEARAKRGEWGGLHLGSERFHQMNIAWGGIDKGVHLIGGDTNMGKSALLRMIAWDVIRHNPKAHVRMYTLDDAEDYFFDSFVAQAAKVPINAINKPDGFVNKPEGYFKQTDYKKQVERGTKMYNEFLDGKYSQQFSFIGTSSLQTTDWTVIEDDIKRAQNDLPEGMELVVCIDNFHDVEIPEYASDTNRKTEEVANRAGKLVEQLGITMIGTAELKKNQQRRPQLDDIFGSRKWKYKARTVILIYSEVGSGLPNPRIKYERIEKPNEPSSVLEVHFAKAKGNEFKGRLFYEQITESGLMVEVPIDRAANYALAIS